MSLWACYIPLLTFLKLLFFYCACLFFFFAHFWFSSLLLWVFLSVHWCSTLSLRHLSASLLGWLSTHQCFQQVKNIVSRSLLKHCMLSNTFCFFVTTLSGLKYLIFPELQTVTGHTLPSEEITVSDTHYYFISVPGCFLSVSYFVSVMLVFHCFYTLESVASYLV